MCGRYLITSAPEAIRALFRYREQPNFPPRYNVAPTQPVPIVRLDQNERHFALVRWGLIPSWVKDPRGFSLLINARSESAATKPAFRAALLRRRCLFPADGFYEWRRDGERKRPYVVRPKSGGLIAFAGLWETWMGPNGEEVETGAILTTNANRTIAHIHDRMPVILAPEAFDMWLDTANVEVEMAETLLQPAPDDLMEAYEISTAVNRVANDSADLLTPAAAIESTETPVTQPAMPKAKRKADAGQGSLF